MVTGIVDDLVLRRADGVPAYNLAVVVDDSAAGVTEVVRGADLLASTPRQAHLADLLGLPRPSWLHVALVIGPDGGRLAKRHGAVTLATLGAAGWSPTEVLGLLAVSLGLAEPGEPVEPRALARQLNPEALVAALPRTDWVLDPEAFT